MLGIAGAYLLRARPNRQPRPVWPLPPSPSSTRFCWLAAAARVRDEQWLAPAHLRLHFRADSRSHALGADLELQGIARRPPPPYSPRSPYWPHCSPPAGLPFRRRTRRHGRRCSRLAIAAHSLLPFLAVLLLLTALDEFATLRSHPVRARLPVAIAADIGLWALIYIYMGDPATRVDYPALNAVALLLPGFAFFAIVAAATVFRTLVQHRPATAFEILQTTIAFLLAAAGLLVFGPPAAAFLLGCISMALAVAGYTVVLLRATTAAGPRTEHVYALWSAALLLAGGWFCQPPQYFAALLAYLAVAAVLVAPRRRQPALEFHAMLFLAAAAVASGLPAYAFRALAATPSGAPSWSIYLLAAAAAYCYFAARPQTESNRKHLALRLVSVLLLLASLAALAAGGLAALLALRWLPQPHHLAFIRTLTLCVAALALAYSGARWRRAELSRMGYAVLVLVAVKLLVEDLRHGHLEFIAASIFLFAITLIAVPRMTRACD